MYQLILMSTSFLDTNLLQTVKYYHAVGGNAQYLNIWLY